VGNGVGRGRVGAGRGGNGVGGGRGGGGARGGGGGEAICEAEQACSPCSWRILEMHLSLFCFQRPPELVLYYNIITVIVYLLIY
jgi:hypothetical protein